jgi:formiminotetrahydrofolate cyclodeaminase
VDALVLLHVNELSRAGNGAKRGFDNRANRTSNGEDHAVVHGVRVPVKHNRAWHGGRGVLDRRHSVLSTALAEVGHTLHQRFARAGYHHGALNHPAEQPDSLLAQPSRAFLDSLASSAPAPGGGAAAALAGALGAALVEMVAHLTAGKKRYAGVEPLTRDALQRAAALRARLQDAVDDDAQAYAAVSHAYGLPRDSEAQKAERTEAIQAALIRAAAAPLEAASACSQVLALCEETAGSLNANVISDVMVAALLAHAALEAALVNVEVNRLLLADATRQAVLLQQREQARQGASEQLARVLSVAGARLPGAAGAS